MPSRDSRYRMDLPPTAILPGSHGRTVADYERALARLRSTENRLREELAQARAQLRQKDELLQQQALLTGLLAWREDAAMRVASLTPRQHKVMDMVLAGQPSKNIAAELGISRRTVECHRASIMKKTGTKSLPALTRLALGAAWRGADAPIAQPKAIGARNVPQWRQDGSALHVQLAPRPRGE